MIKKQRQLLLIAAFVLLSTATLSAQAVTADEPESATATVTGGRFATDVDNFFGVNDWASVEMTKWFATLGAGNVASAAGPWQGGFAIKLPKVYLGAWYSGTFSTGTNGSSTSKVTTTQPDGSYTVTGPTAPGGSGGITSQNFYGVLIGVNDMGFKLTMLDNVRRIDLPWITTAGGISVDQYGNKTGSEGYYRYRYGDLVPKFSWGMAKPLAVGKLEIVPSASLAVQIHYDETETEMTNLATGVVTHTESFANNSVRPILDFDTGGVTVWGFGGAAEEGETASNGIAGVLKVGLEETFWLEIRGEGQSSVQNWANTITPYVTFDQVITTSISAGAKLSLPFSFGSLSTNGGYFSFGGNNGTSVTGYEYPTLDIGLQYRFKTGKLADKLAINAGLAVNLPNYTWSDTAASKTTNAAGVVTVTENPQSTWDTSATLQKVAIGFSFSFTPNLVLDFESAFSGWNAGGKASNQTLLDNALTDTFLDYAKVVLSFKY